jgi:hypothetical protein
MTVFYTFLYYILAYIHHNVVVPLENKKYFTMHSSKKLKFNKNILRLLIKACTFLHVIGWLCWINMHLFLLPLVQVWIISQWRHSNLEPIKFFGLYILSPIKPS